MPRPPVCPLPANLDTYERSWVTPSQAADYLGVKAGTLRKWCRQGDVHAYRRNPRGEQVGDWAIPITSLRLLEHRLGLTVKRSA